MDQKYEISLAAVRRRRIAFALLNLLLLGLGVAPMSALLGGEGWTVFEVILFVIFTVLLAQIVFGFSLAIIGFWVLSRGNDPIRINNTLPAHSEPGELPPTAIVMPVYNEETGRIFQGLRVMYESLEQTGHGKAFDFFVLSDSNNTNHWIAEEMAWLEVCKKVQGFGRIFYRKRRVSLHNKSGNIADFCRRWGNSYRYMIVLDADSIMTGQTFVRLVNLMEHNPGAGIIQTGPQSVLGKSLFQRILQFGTRLCGPIFAAGANYCQAGSGSFWGHNAIIRLRPFMKNCAMPELPESSPLGRRILSHDTIEAALMRRAGYKVWVAYDLEGSYEESPPHLPASLQRDRRWCFGNLQHLWFLFARGLKPSSRFHIFNGILAYVSSPLWLVLLVVLWMIIAIPDSPTPLAGGPAGGGLLLFGYVMLLLLLPKGLGCLLMLFSPRRMGVGGRSKIVLSAVGEMLFSILLAPILMLFHTQFVLAAFFRSHVKWHPQIRDSDGGLSLREAITTHWGHTCLAWAWAGLIAWWKPGLLPWTLPVLLGPMISIPFSAVTSSPALGLRSKKKGWFLVPEETHPPPELTEVEKSFTTAAGEFFRSRDYAQDFGLLQAVLDPRINSVHVSFLRQRMQAGAKTREYIAFLGKKMLVDGPASLTPREKRTLLWDAETMVSAHRKLWSSPAAQLHEWWQAAFRHYNESRALELRRSVDAL